MSIWSWVRDSSLLIGTLPTMITVAGMVSMTGLLAGHTWTWWQHCVPRALAASGLAAAVFQVLKPFPDTLPARVWVWLLLGIFALALATARLVTGRRWWRVAAVPMAVVVVVTAGIKINSVYQYRPTLASALGLPIAGQVSLDTVPRRAPLAATAPRQSLFDSWHPPSSMPSVGEVARVVIPAVVSGFRARPGWVYLPSFLEISGDAEPTLGTHRHTVAAAFGGNESAFRAVNPLDVLARSQLPASAGRLVVGRRDDAATAEARRVIDAARYAGLDAVLVTVPGAHTWSAASAGLTGQLPWLAQRLDLITPPSTRLRAAR